MPSTAPFDPWADILGVHVDAERLEINLKAYQSILEEIKKLISQLEDQDSTHQII